MDQPDTCSSHMWQATEHASPDASAIYVPGNQTARAIEEAIEAEIPLVVAVAEHVPIHDMLRVIPPSLSIGLVTKGLGSLYASNPV